MRLFNRASDNKYRNIICIIRDFSGMSSPRRLYCRKRFEGLLLGWIPALPPNLLFRNFPDCVKHT